MKYISYCVLMMSLFNSDLTAQSRYGLSAERSVAKSSELKRLQSDRFFRPVGRSGNLLVYQMNHKGTTSSGMSAEAEVKIYYDESTRKVIDSVNMRRRYRKILNINQVNDLTLFRGFFKVPSNLQDKLIDELDRGEYLQDYQDIWLETKSKVLKLKSFPYHYFDQDVEYSIDNNGKYAIISTFVSEYLRSTEADSTIFVFDLGNPATPKVQEVYCIECIKPQIVGNYIYYGKKFYYLRGADAYDWKLYRAPIFDLSKSELLAEYVELVYVSPDGKYALGKKLLYGKETFVILDIATKKLQYILGREYTTYRYFYSPAYQQFAFDLDEQIIYIEYPKTFPFNSIGEDATPKRSSSKEDTAFWEKYVHE